MATRRVLQADYERALAASAARPRNPWAVDAVEYDAANDSIQMRFPGGVGLALPVALIAEFANTKKADLRMVYLGPGGETLCLDEADVYVSTRGLIADVFARLPQEMLASRLGEIGGSRSSEAKKAASAENGKKGGRPRKAAPVSHGKQAV